MEKPVLVVMAAGMGSRYGSLKQIDPLGPGGEIIIDYSLYDAARAGFEKVIFIIKKEIEADFKSLMEKRLPETMRASYVFQSLDDLPRGFSAPEGRVKPWGTAHAVLSAREQIGNDNFVVINSDDYYGAGAFKEIFRYMSRARERGGKAPFAMVAYRLGNTLTENGSVSRGICESDENDNLLKVTERTGIRPARPGYACFEDENGSLVTVKNDTPVSMNLWGFTPAFLKRGWLGFSDFLKTSDLKTGEYYLPRVVTKMIDSEEAWVKVLHSKDRWYGVTYKEDRRQVSRALKNLRDSGVYPEKLW